VFFFCASHTLVISLSIYLIKWMTSEEGIEALTKCQQANGTPAFAI
jgi:hypothetical protein